MASLEYRARWSAAAHRLVHVPSSDFLYLRRVNDPGSIWHVFVEWRIVGIMESMHVCSNVTEEEHRGALTPRVWWKVAEDSAAAPRLILFWFVPFCSCIPPHPDPPHPTSPHSAPGMASILMSAVGLGVHFTSAPLPQPQQPQQQPPPPPAPFALPPPPPLLPSASRPNKPHSSSSSVRRAKRQHRRGSYPPTTPPALHPPLVSASGTFHPPSVWFVLTLTHLTVTLRTLRGFSWAQM